MVLYRPSTLGEFAKLRKVTINFVVSVHPFVLSSVHMGNSTPNGWVYIKFDFRIVRRSVKKIQFSLQSDKNSGHFT